MIIGGIGIAVAVIQVCQGLYGSCKTSKVMEFYCGSWKVTFNMEKVTKNAFFLKINIQEN